MIYLLVNSFTPRHGYIFNVIFGIILKTGYSVVETGKQQFISGELKNNDACISYDAGANIKSLIIPDTGLLSENGINEQQPGFVFRDFTRLFCKSGNYNIDFDLFSASFYLITEYEKYLTPVFDKHGRYSEEHYETFRNKLYELPLINIYAEFLWNKLKEIFPFAERNKSHFSYEITIDVDEPWAFINKGLSAFGGFAKDILTNNRKNFSERKKAICSKTDSYDSFNELLEIIEPHNSTFFFLLDGKSNFDSRFTSSNRHYSGLIREISAKGYDTGIHPSYFSFMNEKMIGRQKSSLEKIIGKTVTKSRQHFLKYRLPETNNYLLKNGITDDYTSSLISAAGFRNGIANTFPWFNLEENRMTELMIHPSMAMDTTFTRYMNMPADQAFEYIKQIIDKTYQFNGNFVLIWHNSNYTDFNDFGKWKDVFNQVNNYLKQRFQP